MGEPGPVAGVAARPLKRKLGLAIAILGPPVVLLVAARLLQPPRVPCRISPEKYGLLKVGMTLDEVEAVIGSPPGDYRRHHGAKVYTPLEGDVPHDIGKRSGLRVAEWWGDERVIWVWVDAQGKVAGRALQQPKPPRDVGLWELLKRWLPW
jgi:hypothetical protein